MKKFAKILAAAVLFGTAAGTAFQGAEMIGKNVLVSQNETVKDSASAKLATTTVTTNQSTSISDVSSISEQVLPSIVAIDVTAQTTTNTPFGAQTSEGTGSASGIIIAQKDNKMYIATNNHVVEGATSVTIIFNDESKVSATVKGTDSSMDLAVVEVDMSKLSDSTKKNIKIATIGDSKKTKVGEQAIAIGNALGYGTSVTVGYISAKDREIDAEDSASVKLIQTDAAINPGNSGGALVNSKGEVIAINSSKFASEEVEGMGFAIPIAIGNIFQLFYSLADTRIVGQFLGENALASVGATSSLNNMIIGFLLGMTNGFAIIVARSYGAKDEKAIKKAVAATFVLGIAVSFVFTVLSVGFLRNILEFLNTPQNLIDGAYRYFRIILLGMTGAMLYNVCAGLFRAIGDSITPLIFLIISTFVNIGLDILFVCGFKWGVEGAAFATILSQIMSFVCCFVYMLKKYPVLHFGIKDIKLEKGLVKSMFAIGCSMGFMSSLINIGSVALQGAINSLNNANYIVAHTAARKISEFFMLPFTVFGTTMATFCGQNMGAKKPDRIKKGIWQVTIVTWIWCAFMVLLSYTVVPYMVEMITATKQQQVIDTATLYLRVDTLLYFIPAVICILRNAMQGIGDSVTPVVSSSFELICKVLVATFLTPVLGYWAIIWAEPIAWVIMVIPLLIGIKKNPVINGVE